MLLPFLKNAIFLGKRNALEVLMAMACAHT